MDDFPFKASCEICTGQDVAPLIISAHLETAVVMFEQVPEVICLEQHIVKLYKAQPGFQPCPVTFRCKHPVHTKMPPDISEKFYIGEIREPVSVIDHYGLSVAEINETRQLLL